MRPAIFFLYFHPWPFRRCSLSPRDSVVSQLQTSPPSATATSSLHSTRNIVAGQAVPCCRCLLLFQTLCALPLFFLSLPLFFFSPSPSPLLSLLHLPKPIDMVYLAYHICAQTWFTISAHICLFHLLLTNSSVFSSSPPFLTIPTPVCIPLNYSSTNPTHLP